MAEGGTRRGLGEEEKYMSAEGGTRGGGLGEEETEEEGERVGEVERVEKGGMERRRWREGSEGGE